MPRRPILSKSVVLDPDTEKVTPFGWANPPNWYVSEKSARDARNPYIIRSAVKVITVKEGLNTIPHRLDFRPLSREILTVNSPIILYGDRFSRREWQFRSTAAGEIEVRFNKK